jgi:hypothetical protein
MEPSKTIVLDWIGPFYNYIFLWKHPITSHLTELDLSKYVILRYTHPKPSHLTELDLSKYVILGNHPKPSAPNLTGFSACEACAARTVRKIGSRSYLMLMGTAGPGLVNQRCIHIFLDQLFIVPDIFRLLFSSCYLEVFHISAHRRLCFKQTKWDRNIETSDFLKIKNRFHDNSITKVVKNSCFPLAISFIFSIFIVILCTV